MKEMKKLKRKSLRKMIKRKSVSLTRGLVPEYECFNVCSNAWGSYHTATVAVQARPKRGDGFWERQVAGIDRARDSNIRIRVNHDSEGFFPFPPSFWLGVPTGSVMDGEDVVQEALIEAYRKLEQFDESRPLKPRLFRATHNRSIDFLRRKRVPGEAAATAAVPDAVPPVEPSTWGIGNADPHCRRVSNVKSAGALAPR